MDHHAATPLCDAATKAIERARSVGWANPASVHAAGRASRRLLEEAREQVASAVRARPAEVVLTSGGTEACNLGVIGLFDEAAGTHLITTTVEHPAVARAVDVLEMQGASVTRLAVPGGLAPDPTSFASSLRDDTSLVAVQWVNHETGTVFPIAAYAAICAERGIALLVDATQALGKLDMDLGQIPITALALASHKVGGPAGAGALIVRRTCKLHSRQLGGGQERGRRAGSPDVVSMVGFGAACAAVPERLSLQADIGVMRDRVERALVEFGATVNAGSGPRVATVSNVSFSTRRGSDLVAALDLEGLCCSSGAACSSGLAEPSPVLTAMYPEQRQRALGALRLSFGPESLQVDMDAVLETLRVVLDRG